MINFGVGYLFKANMQFHVFLHELIFLKVQWGFYINKVAAVVPAEEDFNSVECIEPLAHTHYGWFKEHGGVSHGGPVEGEVSNEC